MERGPIPQNGSFPVQCHQGCCSMTVIFADSQCKSRQVGAKRNDQLDQLQAGHFRPTRLPPYHMHAPNLWVRCSPWCMHTLLLNGGSSRICAATSVVVKAFGVTKAWVVEQIMSTSSCQHTQVVCLPHTQAPTLPASLAKCLKTLAVREHACRFNGMVMLKFAK